MKVKSKSTRPPDAETHLFNIKYLENFSLSLLTLLSITGTLTWVDATAVPSDSPQWSLQGSCEQTFSNLDFF